ncbi:cytochrome-b5 reductase [Malassezia sp. CBS 17886]|nr:cytochrome-b5 reductase [Malassezia sp. CBS 17886]
MRQPVRALAPLRFYSDAKPQPGSAPPEDPPKGPPVPQGQSNTAMYLLVGGVSGVAAWYYLGGLSGGGGGATVEAEAGPALTPDRFIPFTLVERKQYNHDSSFYVFQLPNGTVSGLRTASCVVMRGVDGEPKDDKGNPIIRPYTPVTPAHEKNHIDFLIKHYPNGKMTNYLTSLKPGDKVMIKGPIQKHEYSPNQFEEIGLIAGGSGVTPMFQLINEIALNPVDKTKVTFLYANKTPDDILLREKFEELKKDARFNVVHAVDDAKGAWDGIKGFIDKDVIQKFIPSPERGDKVKVFVCGPPRQMSAVSGQKDNKGQQGELKGALAELGYKAEQVYVHECAGSGCADKWNRFKF